MKLKCYLLFRPVKRTPCPQAPMVQDVCSEGEKNEISIDDYLLNNTLLSFLFHSCVSACVCVCVVVVNDARASVILVLLVVVAVLLFLSRVCYYNNYYSHRQNNYIILLITTIILL